jgi:hypothetical protein
MTSRRRVVPILLFLVAASCGGGKVSLSTEEGLQAEANLEKGKASKKAASPDHELAERCDGSAEDRETSAYDTSGDGQPDVRKVFRRIGEPPLARLVLICREVDLNGDNIKDVVRYYDDEGRPLREEADRDFDGKMEAFSIYEHGTIMRREVDGDANGIIDFKVYYDQGKPIRSERDRTGASTADKWQPDLWEYYEEGRMVRMGMDIDGDGRVDRWDRNQALIGSGETPELEDGEKKSEDDSETEEQSSGG